MNSIMHPKPRNQEFTGSYPPREVEFRSQSPPGKRPTPGGRRRIKAISPMSAWQILRNWGLLALAVAIPTGLGLASGLWIDTLWPSTYSWLYILTPVGFMLGACFATFWCIYSESTTDVHHF